jgi:hypothetical protein
MKQMEALGRRAVNRLRAGIQRGGWRGFRETGVSNSAFNRAVPGVGLIVAICVVMTLAPVGEHGDETASLAGSWVGQYGCAQGTTGLTLTVTQVRKSRVRALFHFYADASEPSVPEGCFEMEGTYDSFSGYIELRGGNWIVQPEGYVTVDLTGEVSSGGGAMSGSVIGPSCGKFSLRHVAASSPRARGVCPPRGRAISLLSQP